MAYPVADSYTAGAGLGVHGGRFGPVPLPSWLAGKAVHEFVAVAGSQPSTSAGLVPALAENQGQIKSMVDAWDGGMTDGSRFMIHGGGHADYAGNEIGAIDLTQNAPVWDLLIERTPVSQIIPGSNYYLDDRPTSRHTYYGNQVITVGGVKKLARFNGWMGFAYNGNNTSTGLGGAADVRTVDIDAFNFATNAWEVRSLGAITLITGSETSVATDHTTGNTYAWQGSTGRVWKWTAASMTCAQVADLPGTKGTGRASVFDAAHQRLVGFGGRASAGAVYWDVASASVQTLAPLNGPGAADLTAAMVGEKHGWGIAHDTTRNTVYLMTDLAEVYRVRLDNFYTEKITTTGAVPIAAVNRAWSKFLYIEAIDAVAYLADWASPVLTMRVS